MSKDESEPERLQVGDLTLDTGTHQVLRGGEVLDLPRLSYQLVLELAHSAPNVVSHDELVEKVWPGRVVSPETLTQRIKLVRQALGDDAGNPRYIALVRGEGYRMLASVQKLPPADSGAARSFFAELSRRRVLQVALFYAAVAWSITEVISFLLDAIPVFPDWTKALIAIVFVVGFPVAMFLAWRFDIGPGGVTRTQTGSTAGRLTIAAALALLVGATAGLFYLIYPRVLEQTADVSFAERFSVDERAPNAIAVLPFANTGDNPDDFYMSEGFGDELRDQLGRVDGLQIAARSSSVQFRAEGIDALLVGGQLGVGIVVAGEFRRQGDHLRISVEIADGRTGFQTWSAVYERPAEEVLAIQRELAAEVVRQVIPQAQAALTPATTNVSAYDLMLLARHYEQQVRDEQAIDEELLGKAIELYQQATAADPESALAHSRLGAAMLYLGNIDGAQAPIFKAVTIDPNLPDVQYTLGQYYWKRGIDGAGPAYQLAIKLNPNNADALAAYAQWLWTQGDAATPDALFQRALNIDPLSLLRYADRASYLGIMGRRQETLELAKLIEARFEDAAAYLLLARLYEWTSDLDESIAWALKARALDPDDPQIAWQLAELYARIGDIEAAAHFEPEPSIGQYFWQRRYEDLIELGEDLLFEYPEDLKIYYAVAFAYNANQQFEQAVNLLERSGMPASVYSTGRFPAGTQALGTLMDAYQGTGDAGRARELANWLDAFFQSQIDTGMGETWWANIYFACANSVLGRDEDVLDALERVRDASGLVWGPLLRDARCFQRFADEPRYQAVLSADDQRREELRRRLPDTLARHQTIQ